MKLIKPQDSRSALAVPENIPEGITEVDEAIFSSITDFELTPEQRDRIIHPSAVFPREKTLLAVHWHPEFVPMDLIERRISAMFPNVEDSLIIPTQHNVLMHWNEFAGVEVDCYSRGFNQKVQLLLHFRKERLDSADVLKSMLRHTFQYRSSQLFEYIGAITRPNEDWIGTAADKLFVSPSGAVGSVGVVSVHVDESRRLEEEGLTVTVFSAGKYKAEFASFAPLTEEAKGHETAVIADIYGDFVASVARHRGTSAADVRANYGEGRVVQAGPAVKSGMADGVRTLRDVASAMAGSVAAGKRRAEARKIWARAAAKKNLARRP